MIRRGTVYQLVAFALITLVGVSFVMARYVGLGDRWAGGSYVVSVDLARSGGIFANAEVTYRGVTVGRVEALRLSQDGVVADLRLDAGTRVPADTDAVVENRSAVGEQYVDLQPRTSAGPFLQAGATIARARTSTPVPSEQLLVNLDRLVRSVDAHDLVVVVEELGKAFAGGGRDLQRLLDAGDRLTIAATAALPQTEKLIDDGAIVLDTQRDTGPSIRAFATNLADVSETLAGSDADLRLVLDRGVIASKEVQTLLTDNRTAIAGLLTNLVTIGQITQARVDGLELVLVAYPSVVAGGYTVVPGDGTAHFGLVLNSGEPKACTRGYEATQRTAPEQTSGLPPLNTGAMCAASSRSGTNVRGAQNAPRPASGPSASRMPGGDSWAGAYPLVGTGPARSPGLDRPVALDQRFSPGRALHGDDALLLLLTGERP